MIRINSQTLKRIVNQLRYIFRLSPQAVTPLVISASGVLTRVAIQTASCSVACELDVPNSEHCATIPLRALLNLKSSARHEFAVRQQGQIASVSYWDGQETVTEEVPVATPKFQPPLSDCWLENPLSLGSVLYDYSQLTDDRSTRYSLSCLRLRGRDGQVAVTDSRLAAVHDGFNFPLEEGLVPTEHLRRMKFLSRCTKLEVGVSPNWIHFRVTEGLVRWAISIRLDRCGRYPTIDQCFPRLNDAMTTIRISDVDAEFIASELPKALGQDGLDTVTLIAERLQRTQKVSVRFRSREIIDDSSPRVIELSLSTSTFDRLDRHAALNARNFLTALQFGYREFNFLSYPAPAYCELPNRRLVFTVFPVDFVITQSPSCLVLSPDNELSQAS